ncbi:uncharacterized protein LOC106134940 [Amyelois transitella]|uniref:uncharacterized protein LOC106134940 n=1 Tax=Amyelois transitella TaxID=680683 RepID=UPI00067CD38F|nr:uncharacterized protein LOC106134940 [Amyelois transitella]
MRLFIYSSVSLRLIINEEMAKEDLLRVEMRKLEIQPNKPNFIVKEDNPFNHQSLRLCVFSRSTKKYKCFCTLPKRNIIPTISKKKNKSVLKEPVLKLLQNSNSAHKELNKPVDKTDCPTHNLNSDIISLCSLVDDCNQLRISPNVKKNYVVNSEQNNRALWWKNDISHARIVKKTVMESNQGSSCSQQALNPPCDITIDELASYFETLVHIPKKMSSMAEMMYI